MSGNSRRGFAAMDPAKVRAIASKGGRAAHARGTAHEFTPEEARQAGRKGGQAGHARGTAHEFTPEEARQARVKGGQIVETNPEVVDITADPAPDQMSRSERAPDAVP